MSTTPASTPSTRNSASTVVILSTAFMLFSMYFGAGNLIFPTMIGASAGTNYTSAIIGFLIGDAVLSALGLIALAVSGNDFRLVTRRVGKVFTILFPTFIFLIIGPLFAVPRVGSVSFATSFDPFVRLDTPLAAAGIPVSTETATLLGAIVFNGIFFTIALLLAWNPSRLLDSIGKVLTPLLLGFMLLLIALTVITFSTTSTVVAPEYVASPLSTGMLKGYLTMDSIGAITMGIIVVHTLRDSGSISEPLLVRSTVLVATIAAVMLSLTYLGLGAIGQRVPNSHEYKDGATLLLDASRLTMGTPGQLVFALIVLLACMTTAVGLISAASHYFHQLLPQMSYKTWTVIFAAISFALAIRGLNTVVKVAGPLIGFLYPIAMTVIALAFVSKLVEKRTMMPFSFKLVTGTTIVWSALVTLTGLGFLPETVKTHFLDFSPLAQISLGWLVPMLIAAVIAIPVDLVRADNMTKA